jgi:hypothetical protein
MLSEKQVKEVKEHLEKAQNPIFYFDNDNDGLCSFLLFRRYLERGKGVAVRSYPDVDAGYARRASELGADYVFVLDKPVISKEFVEAVIGLGLPMVVIDHHGSEQNREFDKMFEDFILFDAAEGSVSGEPVTYLAYKITGERKEDMWIAMMGCIADHYLPDFADEFGMKYGEFWKSGIKKPFDAYYGTEIGRIARAVGFGLKDSITHVVQMQNFLVSVKGPDEVFSEVKENYNFRKKYKEIEENYNALLERARKQISGNLIFFSYSGDLSISADISNQLSHDFPGKFIAIGYKKEGVTNLSMRGSRAREILEKIRELLAAGMRRRLGRELGQRMWKGLRKSWRQKLISKND